ncbi:MAG: hypothetical protein V4553_08905 [Bacteroidota bacterium]
MPFLNTNSLRAQITKELRIKHESLFDNPYKEFYNQCLEKFFSKQQWWLIGLLTIFIFWISRFINIDFLNFITLKKESAVGIVDQRTSNVATIISMTIAVIGFLISNIAVKESFAYRLLFERSRLYTVIYFILSTIACLICISALRETIKDDFIYVRLIITGTYCVVLILFLIGLLFRRIIRFTNSKEIQEMFHNEMIKEAKTNLKAILISQASVTKITTFFEESGLTDYSLSAAMDRLNPFSSGPSEIDKKNQLTPMIVDDIYLPDIDVYIKQLTNKEYYYRNLSLEKSVDYYDDFIFPKEGANLKKNKRKLSKLLNLKKIPKKHSDKYKVRTYFEQKLEEFSNENKYKSMEGVLDTYLEVLVLEMKNI